MFCLCGLLPSLLVECCLFSIVGFKFSTLSTVVVDDLRRSCRMQGLPPEYYQPIPPHSPKDTSRGDIVDEENYFDTGSVATPLIKHSEGVITSVQEGFIHPTNPPLNNPLGPLLFRVNSLGEIVSEDYFRLP
jgi:hypothetical protein